jgi:polysaccharide export outer membrane protein
MGAVGNPGVFYLQGPTSLATVLALAGGVASDGADLVQVSRRNRCGFSLPEARNQDAGHLVAAIPVSALVGAQPRDPVMVCPDDVVSVPRAKLVYVVGEVRKPGGIMLRDGETISLLQALTLAEGLARTASARHARLLRPVRGQETRSETEIDLTKIFSGKHPDRPLVADDILFVPNSAARSATLRGLEAALQMCTGVVIWRR